MHGMIHSQLTGDALGKLDALAHELLAKRDESMPTLGSVFTLAHNNADSQSSYLPLATASDLQ